MSLRDRLRAKNLPAWGETVPPPTRPIKPEQPAFTPMPVPRRRKAKDRHPGITCHLCDGKTRVLETRVHPAGVYRRRQCLQCGARLSSVERIEEFGKENA